MIEEEWTIWPYPFSHMACECAVPPLDAPVMVERLLEDCAGVAGVIASAAVNPECDQEDVLYASRLLAELLHSTVALWYQWRQQEDPDETAAAPSPAHTSGSPRARRGTVREGTPGCAGKEGEA
jgi:hypothetical protein